MTPKAFTAGWLMAAAVLSSWAVSFASDEQPVRRSPQSRASNRPPLPPLSVEVDAEVSRLAERSLEIRREVSVSARDPFSFGRSRTERTAPRVERAAPVVSEAPVAEPPVVVERAPEPMLSGLAEVAPGVMTAVISFRDELHFLKKGEVLASRYRVDVISADAVEVFDLVTNKIVRLSLQRTMIVQSAV